MKNRELYEVRIGLSLMDGLAGVKLGVCRAKASRTIERLIEDMEAFKKSEAWAETDKILDEINRKHAKKDDKGNYVISNNMYVFEDDLSREKDIQEAKDKNKFLFKEREKMATEYKNYLVQKCLEKVDKIPLSLLPPSVKTEVVTLLWPIIDEKK